MDLSGYRMTVHIRHHPEYAGVGDYFGSGKSRPRNPNEWVPFAEALAAEHGGVLPGPRWLCRNGNRSMEAIIRRNPGLFSHIRQDRKGKRALDWVSVAEGLASEHGGILPGSGWLRKHKYGALDSARRKHPDLFAHIRQKLDGGKSVEEWVAIAEKLASENGGRLPCCAWLSKHGYQGLYKTSRAHPERFNHIELEIKKGRSVEEWVSIAERLAVENGGLIPYFESLAGTEYSGLPQVVRANPDLFAHLGQEKRGKSPEEWVPVAEKLASDNSGRLPSYSWLVGNSYSGLAHAMRRRPELFTSFSQESGKGRSPGDWVALAERIAANNGGVLPWRQWLVQNGYGALYDFKSRAANEDLFKHIKQERKNRRVRDSIK